MRFAQEKARLLVVSLIVTVLSRPLRQLFVRHMPGIRALSLHRHEPAGSELLHLSNEFCTLAKAAKPHISTDSLVLLGF